MSWLWKVTDGWKLVLAYLLANIPIFHENPPLTQAINDLIAAPGDWRNWLALGVQILFVVGVLSRVKKNLVNR